MDEVYLSQLIQNASRLKIRFGGIYPADKFPILLPTNTFVFNSEISTSTGKHWVVCSNAKGEYNLLTPSAWTCFLFTQILPEDLSPTLTFRQLFCLILFIQRFPLLLKPTCYAF